MLYDKSGSRKYLTASERRDFIAAALEAQDEISTFALALTYSGGRISEILSTTPRLIDFAAGGLVLRTLKRRRKDVFRIVPLPLDLLDRIERVHNIRSKQRDLSLLDKPIWPWCRTTAWAKVKVLMHSAKIVGPCAVPKGLRHGFAVEGTTVALVPLGIMQKWLGHARIETTAIYTNALGAEERSLAARLWD